MHQNQNGLKKSFVVLSLGLLFLVAPFGNIAVSLYALGVASWYSPLIWAQALPDMTGFSQLWLGLVFVSGILILLQAKLAWVLAICSMAVVLALNIFNITSALSPQIYDFGFFLSSVGIVVLLFYFRYPYLDRRGNIILASERKETQIPAELTVGSTKVRGTLRNVSSSGFFMIVDVNVGAIRRGSEGTISVFGDQIEFTVARVESSGVGGEFHGLSESQKSKLTGSKS